MAQGERWPTASTRRSSTSPRPSLLAGREGEVFDAVVVDEDRRGARRSSSSTRRCSPASQAHRVDPGDEIRVQLHTVDLAARRIELSRVG